MSNELSAEPSPWKRVYGAGVVAILVAMSALMLNGYRDKSPTEDEWAHLTRGIGYYQVWDARLHYSHPPFANAVQGLASLGQDLPRVDEMRYWKYADVGQVALELIQEDYEHARNALMRARLVTMLFGLALAAYAFFWGFSLFGPLTGFLAMGFVAFNPTVIAQARYATTDMAAATMMTIAVGELSRYLAGQLNGKRGWMVPFWLGLAAATKHTGTLLIPVFALVVLVFYAASLGRFRDTGRSLRGLARLGGQLFVGGVIAWFVISATFKFDNTFLRADQFLEVPEPRHWTFGRSRGRVLEAETPIPMLPSWMPIPFPQVYVAGLVSVSRHNRSGFKSFFMGESMRYGPATYFPTLLAIKNPVPMLAGLLAGIFAWLRRRRMPHPAVLCVGGIVVILLSVMMRSNLMMGVRHALPVIGMLSLLAGRGAAAALEWLAPTRAAPIGAAWVGLTALSAIIASPHYLGYFNFFVGRERGHEISIYGEDWGQDRVHFAEYVEEHDLSPLYYNPMTKTRRQEVRYLGIPSQTLSCRMTPPPGSYAALHALSFKTANGKRCWKWRHDLEPIAHINHHIYIWKMPDAEPEPAPPSELGGPDEPGDEPEQEGRQVDDSEHAEPEGDAEGGAETERRKHESEE